MMFDRLSNDEIADALAELIALLGIKEDLASDDFDAFLRQRDMEGCVQQIATELGLPVRINLSYVPQDFRPGDPDGFVTTALVDPDPSGGGTQGIIAQVSVPQHTPMFGSPRLKGYPIQVRISETCHKHPDTFVAIMAHELSHVLLAALWSTHRDSDLHADLVPIILGFRDYVRYGRKRIETWTSGSTTTKETTIYGYLTDSQFEFACEYVAGLLKIHSQDKYRLLRAVKRLQKKLARATHSLETFRDYFRHLDAHPRKRMKEADARRVVQLHTREYSREWESRIAAVRKTQQAAKSFLRGLNHYTTSTVEQLNTHRRELDLASDQLDQVAEEIAKDKKILQRYVGFVYRLRSTVRRYLVSHCT